MNEEPRYSSEITDEVAAVYQSLARDVDAIDDDIDRAPVGDLAVPSVAGQLQLPLDLWASDRKPTRTVPALVAYDRRLDPDATDDLRRLLVGLDVLVTMLDEFVDTDQSEGSYRLQLAVNVAFASYLSFTNLPADETAATDAVLRYLVETARIPTVERAVQRELETVDTWERARELIRFVYASRARDISVFGRLPALVTDVDERTAERIASDLETYRAHYLLFDDVRDVREDVRNGIETPVVWLLKTHDDPDEIVDAFVEIFQTFEYAETPYRARLRDLEREPDDVREALEDAMEELDAVSDVRDDGDAVSKPVKPVRNPQPES